MKPKSPAQHLLTLPITRVSIETMAELDLDLGDDGRQVEVVMGDLRHDEILELLTPEMREVAELAEQGYQRKEIAQIRGTTEVAVWKSVSRMRERLTAHGLRPKPRIR